MEDFNPYESPSIAPDAGPDRPATVTGIMGAAWQIYVQNFSIIAAIVVIIWFPLELLSSYMNYFVFDAEEVRRPIQLAQFLDNFFGIIVTAAIISLSVNVIRGVPASFGNSMSAGFANWGRMLLTRILTNLLVGISFLLLIVPGVYVAIRLAIVDSVVVAEGTAGATAMRRSFDLTRGHFWMLFQLAVWLILLTIVVAGVCVLPFIFFPEWDDWVVDASLSTVLDLVIAYVTICLYCAYRDLARLAEGELEALQE